MTATQELQERFAGYAKALALEVARGVPGADRDEMIACGYLGLAEAAASFDPTAGARFETFAYYRIRGAVFDGLRKSSGLPRRSRARVAAEQGADSVVQASHGAGGDAGSAFAGAVRGLGVVFAASGLGEDEPAREPAVSDAPSAAIESRELRSRLREAVAALPEESRQIVEAIYIEQRTMTEYAARLGVHKSTLSRQHAKAIEALQALLTGPAPG